VLEQALHLGAPIDLPIEVLVGPRDQVVMVAVIAPARGRVQTHHAVHGQQRVRLLAIDPSPAGRQRQVSRHPVALQVLDLAPEPPTVAAVRLLDLDRLGRADPEV